MEARNRTLSIPMADQAMMAAGDEATRARYSNPLRNLRIYLRSAGRISFMKPIRICSRAGFSDR